jgi:hypothetical protein
MPLIWYWRSYHVRSTCNIRLCGHQCHIHASSQSSSSSLYFFHLSYIQNLMHISYVVVEQIQDSVVIYFFFILIKSQNKQLCNVYKTCLQKHYSTSQCPWLAYFRVCWWIHQLFVLNGRLSLIMSSTFQATCGVSTHTVYFSYVYVFVAFYLPL